MAESTLTLDRETGKEHYEPPVMKEFDELEKRIEGLNAASLIATFSP